MADSETLVCYTIGFNFVTSSNQYFPCGGGGGGNGTSSGGAQSCCYAGDYCMEDSICHYTHTVTNGTGYYMAGCTDPTWRDPACPKQCTSEYGADIVYDTTNDQWNCCFSREGYLTCQQPSDFIVQAPAPGKLETLTQLNTPVPEASLTAIGSISSYLAAISTISGAPESTSTPSTSIPATASSSTSSSNTAASATARTSASATPSASGPGGGLSGGAIAGIVIGAIAGLTIIAIAALVLYRWNKRNNAAIRGHEMKNNPTVSELGSGDAGKLEYYAHVADEGKPSYGGSQNPGGEWGQSLGGWAQSPASAGGYGVGQYHELSSPDKEAQQPAELMASPGRARAELGDGRKSALGG